MNAESVPRLVPVRELNGLELDQFVASLRPLFEAADPLARALYAHRPFASYSQLVGRAEWLIQTLTRAEQIEVVNAHPRIGETPSRLSSLSYREQASHQEANLPPDERQHIDTRLAELNRTYERQFGFHFVVFVQGRPKSAIVDVLETRLHNAAADELQTGLREMFLIAHDRLRLLTPHR